MPNRKKQAFLKSQKFFLGHAPSVITGSISVWVYIYPYFTDNVYPPQKKSFSMMRYVHDHHLTDYEWFLRLDDDAYVHIEHLESLLRRINSSDSLYIGSPGFGRDNDDFVEDNMVYCMGGPGIGK